MKQLKVSACKSNDSEYKCTIIVPFCKGLSASTPSRGISRIRREILYKTGNLKMHQCLGRI